MRCDANKMLGGSLFQSDPSIIPVLFGLGMDVVAVVVHAQQRKTMDRRSWGRAKRTDYSTSLLARRGWQWLVGR